MKWVMSIDLGRVIFNLDIERNLHPVRSYVNRVYMVRRVQIGCLQSVQLLLLLHLLLLLMPLEIGIRGRGCLDRHESAPQPLVGRRTGWGR